MESSYYGIHTMELYGDRTDLVDLLPVDCALSNVCVSLISLQSTSVPESYYESFEERNSLRELIPADCNVNLVLIFFFSSILDAHPK